jgi:monoamine oxidase
VDSTPFDVVILGGGIAGLYTAYRFLQHSPSMRLLLVEKNKDLGGRIYTYHDPGGKMTVEAGAGRFSDAHVRLWGLLEECGLSKQVVPNGREIQYIPSGGPSGEPGVPADGPQKDLEKVFRASRGKSRAYLQKKTFVEFASEILDPAHIRDSFGYSTELVQMNAYDAIQILRTLDTQSHTFYSLRGGLSQLIDELVRRIREFPNAVIWTEHTAVEVSPPSGSSRSGSSRSGRSTQKKSSRGQSPGGHSPGGQSPGGQSPMARVCIRSGARGARQWVDAHHVVFALPRPALEAFSWMKPFRRWTSQVVCGSLCRIYSRFSPKPNRTWLDSLSKTTTNTDVRMIIPIRSKEGIVMISYSDNVFADRWVRLKKQKGIEGVNARLAELIPRTVKGSFPTPEDTQLFYWPCGVGYWGVGANSAETSKKLIQPAPDVPFYVCGEHYSEMNQQWIEGALETSEAVLARLLGSAKNVGKAFSPGT